MSGTNEHVSSFGGVSSPSSTLAHVGYAPLSNKYANAKFDEIAIWQSDQSSNMSSIYTGPEPVDLSGLSTPPDEWFRLEQNTNNSSGSASVTLYNAPSYSTDVPGAPGGGGGGGEGGWQLYLPKCTRYLVLCTATYSRYRERQI